MVLHYCHSVYSALKGKDDNKMKSGQYTLHKQKEVSNFHATSNPYKTLC